MAKSVGLTGHSFILRISSGVDSATNARIVCF
jgi:hypothetical protein